MSKVLLVAFACCPGMGSEAGIGWNFALGLSRRHEVTLLTTDEFKTQVDAYLAAHPDVHLRVLYHNTFLPRSVMFQSYATANVYYYAWQLRIIPLVRRLQRRERFDLIHHVNWGRYWMLAGAAFAGAPFVWGPIGAAEGAPFKMLGGMSLRGKISEITRNLMRRVFEFDPLTRLTARRAACAIAATRETESCLREWRVADLELLCSVGVDAEDLPALVSNQDAQGYDFISIGRLLDWKGFHLGLRAFALADLPGSRYAIAGDGPELARLKALVVRLGIRDRVDFLGHMPRQQCLQILGRSRVLVHPSLHDSGGFVLVEAMALGKPVICLNIGGPAVIVDENSGISISAASAEEAVARIVDAMQRLRGDEALYSRLSVDAWRRGQSEFLWSRKMDAVDRIYARILARPLGQTFMSVVEGHSRPSMPDDLVRSSVRGDSNVSARGGLTSPLNQTIESTRKSDKIPA